MGLFGSINEVLEFAIDRGIEANQLYEAVSNYVDKTLTELTS